MAGRLKEAPIARHNFPGRSGVFQSNIGNDKVSPGSPINLRWDLSRGEWALVSRKAGTRQEYFDGTDRLNFSVQRGDSSPELQLKAART